MEVSYETALKTFARLNEETKAPSLHPWYVIADARRSADLKPTFFVFEEDEACFYHGFHVAKVTGTDFKDIQSPYGYGGPAASSDDAAFLGRAWAAYVLWCKKNNVLVEFIRFHPLLENWRYYQGEIIPDRQTVWIDLDSAELLMTYSVRVRTAIRKATKEGLRVKWVEAQKFMEIFPQMYKSVMTELKADEIYYFNQDYFSKLLFWENAHFAVCLLADEPVASAIFLAEQAIMEYHLSASTIIGKKLAATNLILHEATLLGKKLGCRALHMGGGTDNNADNALLFFKAGFSKNRGLFKIGKQVHQDEAYTVLKKEWQKKNGDNSNRILFYRT
jgi:hypothetical protein